MKMENNPIDKLFADRLGQLERAPNAEAWSQLQGRMHKRKKGAFWWGSIAASVLLLIVSGILGWRYVNTETKPMNNQQANVHSSDIHSSTEKNKITPASTSPSQIAAASPEKQQNKLEEKPASKIKQIKRSKVRTQPSLQPIPAPQPEPLIAEADTYPEVNQVLEPVKAEIADTRPTVLVMTFAELPTTARESQSALTSVSKQDDTTKEEPIIVAGKKKTRAGKLIQQLKHIKNGGKVDWKELGIHPESLLALVKPDHSNKNHSPK